MGREKLKRKRKNDSGKSKKSDSINKHGKNRPTTKEFDEEQSVTELEVETLEHVEGSKPENLIAKLSKKLKLKLDQDADDLLPVCAEPEVTLVTREEFPIAAHVCPWCPYTADDKEVLEHHIGLCHRLPAGEVRNSQEKTHSEGSLVRNHTCNVCGKSYTRNFLLKRHYITHSVECPFVCIECGSSFSTANQLKIHNYIHTDDRPFRCKHCPDTFASKENLKLHLRTHTIERPYQCIICGDRFTKSSFFKVHFRNHISDKPALCVDCGKAFSTSDDLLSHRKIHSKRPSEKVEFCCDTCGQSFSRRKTLIYHLRVHTGKKPFSCHLCDKTFTNSYNNRLHMKNLHNVELNGSKDVLTFTCLTCKKEFFDLSDLKCHLREHVTKK